MLLFYLIALFIAPQLWLEPFIGMRVDFYIYPLWFLLIAFNGRLADLAKFNLQDAFFLGMILWTILSIALNDKNPLSTLAIESYIKWFILYRFISVVAFKDGDLSSTIRKITFVVFIVVIESIDHKYFSPDLLGWANQSLGWVAPAVLAAGGTGRTQWVNIFDGPGVFCVMFTLILPFLLVKLDPHYKKSTKLTAVILMLPILLAIWATGSRGGLLATIAIFGCYFLTRVKVSFFTMVKIGVLPLILLAFAPTHLTETKDSSNSAQNRVVMWAFGLDMVQENPVFGVGRANYSRYTGSLIAHNSFIENMAETGFIGVFLWVGLLYFSFKAVYLYTRIETEPIKISSARGVGLSLIGYLVSSFFVTLEYETLYLLIALTRAMCGDKQIDLKPSLKDFFAVLGIVFGMFVIVKIFVAFLYF